MTEQTLSHAPVYGIFDPDYARIFTIVRKSAYDYGYAVCTHGSFTKDLDLLAVPWTEHACEAKRLLRCISSRLADDLGLCYPIDFAQPPVEKPHGRLVWTFNFKHFGDPRYVDFGVMPLRA